MRRSTRRACAVRYNGAQRQKLPAEQGRAVKQTRENAREHAREKMPTRQDWAALCGAVMRCEVMLEKLSQDAGLSEARRSAAFSARLRKLQHEPAYRWLAVQPPYQEALAAFTRRVAASDVARFELLSAVTYAMEALHAEEVAPAPAATASTRRQAMRHAGELALLVARDSAGFADHETDEALLALLQRYIADNEKLVRAAPATRAELTPQLRFGKDVAHLLWAAFGAAPPSVIRPLLRLAGPAVGDRDAAALVSRMKREARLLTGKAPSRTGRYLLDRIVLAPTSRSRKTVGAAR